MSRITDTRLRELRDNHFYDIPSLSERRAIIDELLAAREAAAAPATEQEITAWVDAAHSRPIDDIDRAVTKLHIAVGAAMMRRRAAALAVPPTSVLDVRATFAKGTHYYQDVQDVCKIALEAMDERDRLREQVEAISHDLKHAVSATLNREVVEERDRLKAAAQQPAADEAAIEAWEKRARSILLPDCHYNVTPLEISEAVALMRRAPARRDEGLLLRELRAFVCDIGTPTVLTNGVRQRVLAKIDELLASQPEPKSDAGLRGRE